MARTRSFDQDQTTAAAMNLFWDRGYADTSLADLEQHTGLNRSSIYQFYGSKRGLFDAAVQLYLRQVFTPRLTVLAGPEPGLDRLRRYFDILATTLEKLPADLMQRGCLVVNSATELAGHDDQMRLVAQEYRRVLGEAISGAMTDAATAGHFPTRDVLRRTDILLSGVIGVLVTSRFDLALARRTAIALAGEVHSWRV